MGFGLLALTKKKSVNKAMETFRNLEQSEIEDLLERIRDVNLKILNLLLTEQQSLTNSFESYKVYTELITSEYFINNNEGMKQYKTFSRKNKLIYIDLSSLEKRNIVFTQTNFKYPDQESSSYAILNTLEEFENETKFDTFLTSPKEETDIDYEKYEYYINKKIDIYNPDDPAFAQFCYFTHEFEFDLTQEYRKEIFQYKTPIVRENEKKCKYQSIDVENKEIIFKCTITLTDEIRANITLKDVPETGLWEYKDIALICPGYVKHIEKNIAFWVFLFFNVLVIVYDIVISIISQQNVISDSFFKALENDGFEVGDRKQLSGEKIEPQLIPGNEIVVGLEVNQRPLDYIFCHNISALHPLLSLGYNSIIQPPIMTSWFFLLSMINYFGFNAVYFSPAMLKDRIYDRHRDNFDFPMRTEFEKIMSAICTNMLITFVIRLISMVAVWERNDLGESIIQAKNQRAKFISIGDFNSRTMGKRALAGIFILLLDVFFWFYTITFCGMYVKAQYGWLYSGVWTLLWTWVVFSPIYIFIISLVEYTGNPHCAYYMKRLFIF